MTSTITEKSVVYAVFVMGTDYYDQLELYKLFANKEDADECARQLRLQEVPYEERLIQDEPELEFACVEVQDLTVH